MTSKAEDPYAALDLARTLDAAQVKLAYFAALKRHPPHTDAVGFRRVRDAYEALTRPGGLDAAYARAPVDLDAELAALGTRLDAPLAAARAAMERDAAAAGTRRRFIDTFSRLPLADALRRVPRP